MSDRRYEITALEFPIVYTGDGDHDRNGLLYTPDAFVPLLRWVRDRWRADDEWLPEAHRRDQLIGLLLDGLERYRLMLQLMPGNAAGRALRHYRGRLPDPEREPEEPDLEVDPAWREIEQNFRATVDELAAALNELTGGAVRQVSTDPAVRAGWSRTWTQARRVLSEAIALRLAEIDKDWIRDRPGLARRCGLAESDVDRLLLNDFMQRPSPGVTYDRVNPLRPLPVVRPLVLRARHGETVEVRLRNETNRPKVGLHRQGSGLVHGVAGDDGAQVGRNPDSTARRDAPYTYHWTADAEGVWPLNDLADVRGTEDGTNVHGLFGAFVVEPAGTWWRDPETGHDVTDSPLGTAADVDVLPQTTPTGLGEFVDFASDGGVVRPHREFTIFIHDEPEVHSALHIGGGEHTVMPLNYRAEPMPNRLPHRMREYAERTSSAGHAGIDDRHADTPFELRAVERRIDRATLAEEFWVGRRGDGSFIERVAGEEQHHSSWLFGDPVTPILRAYRGDPCRVRLVHAGIKETHVFHLHVHQWRAVATDTAPPGTWNPRRGSQLLDSITIGPQTGFTIDPLYGSGSRQHLFGDVIWHCHLYPHFHHGMWGLWRSLDEVVEQPTRLPDGTPCAPLVPLPGRAPEDAPGHPSYPSRGERAGFPWFIDAGFPQKSPPPPAAAPDQVCGRRRLLELPDAAPAEVAAFAPDAATRPGAPFVALDHLSTVWNQAAGLPSAGRTLSYDVVVRQRRLSYNSIGWYDRRGHFYELRDVVQVTDGGATTRHRIPAPTGRREPFFLRANHGDVVELRLHNELGTFEADHFDFTQLPVECGLHVHLVKFDVLAADGSSTGWNYLSGASCSEAVGGPAPGGLPPNVGLHRWVVDEEFGPCFFHDHLLANYRQKHGLFAALVAQPPGSTWTRPRSAEIAWSGAQAVVTPGAATGVAPYREAGLGVGDFVPLYDRHGKPLNPPGELGGDDDPGVMAVNYRNAPLTARGPDPSRWFATDERRRGRDTPPADDEARASWLRDPDTPIIEAHPGERLRIRLLQGSHEEQHSFVTHGLRWRRDWGATRSTLVNQQTLGISEAFTLVLGEDDTPFGVGDHLWRFSAMDDLWLGCWGIVRVLPDGEGPPRIPGTTTPPPRRRPDRPDRDWVVRARRVEHEYDGLRLTDPFGLVYEVVHGDTASPYGDDPSGTLLVSTDDRAARPEPLVLRCSPGDWIRIRLFNEVRLPRVEDETEDWTGPVEDPLLPRFGPEPHPPPLPLDPDRRTVSPRVSLHPSLLLYDVTSDDGAYVGGNRDSTVAPLPVGNDHGHGPDDGAVADGAGHGHERGNWREYWWYADDALGEGDGQVCYLHDMADVRNHRHHGLVGAIVVEPRGWVPDDETGPRTTLRWWGRSRDEHVLFWQDGLRHYVHGDLTRPVSDVEPGDDPEDAGQKGVSYRCAPVHAREQLSDADPATPVWTTAGREMVLRLVGACDKPRNHTFTVHGAQWSSAPWSKDTPQVGALSGLTADTVHDLRLTVADGQGDLAYRSGAFRWAVGQGMWGIVRST